MQLNHYYEDGTIYLGNKREKQGNTMSEHGAQLYTWIELGRKQRIIAKCYWPHSMIPHPARLNPVKATTPWVRK